MRTVSLLLMLTAAAPALAQNWYVPDNVATTGACNVIPFGQPGPGSFANCRYQTRLLASDLGATANIVTGLGFAPCGPGRAHFDTLEIVLDHIPPSQLMTTTFASNLTPAAVTVLSATNYTWNVTAGNAWIEIGLQSLFVYNGVDDVVVQITTANATAPGNGAHRGTRERIYWIGASGSPPPTGSTDFAAGKIEVSMLMGRTSSHGDGCLGSNGTPSLGFTGSPVQGNTITFDLTNGVQNGIALLVAGFTNAAPFPFDLGVVGAPGCSQFTDLGVTLVALTDPAGAASIPLAIPPAFVGFRFFTQYAVLDPAANAFGFTTSNYLNVLTGN
jgi:hypothetical protein